MRKSDESPDNSTEGNGISPQVKYQFCDNPHDFQGPMKGKQCHSLLLCSTPTMNRVPMLDDAIQIRHQDSPAHLLDSAELSRLVSEFQCGLGLRPKMATLNPQLPTMIRGFPGNDADDWSEDQAE